LVRREVDRQRVVIPEVLELDVLEEHSILIVSRSSCDVQRQETVGGTWGRSLTLPVLTVSTGSVSDRLRLAYTRLRGMIKQACSSLSSGRIKAGLKGVFSPMRTVSASMFLSASAR